jgi:hypothetical protein
MGRLPAEVALAGDMFAQMRASREHVLNLTTY